MSAAKQRPEDDLNFEMGAAYGEIYTLIAPPSRTPWLEECDYNCFYSDIGEFAARVSERFDSPDWQELDKTRRKLSLDEWQALGFDRNSVFADPLFVDPEHDDYTLKPDSPALKLGFENFDMKSFGPTQDFSAHWHSRPAQE